MKRKIIQYLILTVILIGLPLLCAWIDGNDEIIRGLTAFPPRTEDWGSNPSKLWNLAKPFSWPVFIVMAAAILLTILPFAIRTMCYKVEITESRESHHFRFPLFGWVGLALCALTWIVAWNRFPWFAPFQKHTFLPFWLSYILVINALSFKRTGRSLMTSYPRVYAMLFPVSSLFWWFFEYLNRYVWNWYYVGISDMGALEYTFFASCSFATVLPAVTSTAEWLGTFRSFSDKRLCGFRRINLRHPVFASFLALTAATGLMGIVFRPDLSYPLLWISPLTAFLAVQLFAGEKTILDKLSAGDWRLPVRFALASLICGWFWEMWNWQSAAKWIYAVPYVHRYQIFEMPLLGFAGYIPFGLECAVVAAWVLPALASENKD